jgi:hypothetical protein
LFQHGVEGFCWSLGGDRAGGYAGLSSAIGPLTAMAGILP